MPYDHTLTHLFFGEELSMAARLWTSGFDFFAPPETVLYHLWSRSGRRTLDDDAAGDARTQMRRAALDRVHALLEGRAQNHAFGLGTDRSLEAFEDHAKLDLKRKALKDGATDAGLPPDAFCAGSRIADDLAALGVST